MSVYVIVDGNNLAHYLYTIGAGRPVPPALDEALVAALDGWARAQEPAARQPVEVEYCLDPRSAPVLGNQHVSVLVVDPGKKADNLVIRRLDYHAYQEDRCLVVSGDEALVTSAAEYQGLCLRVSEFCTPVHSGPPVFEPLPRRIPRVVMPQLPPGATNLAPAAQKSPKSPAPIHLAARAKGPGRRAGTSYGEYDRLVEQTLAGRNPISATAPESAPPQPDSPAPLDPPVQAPRLARLSPQTWPAKAGEKFLMESFCPAHRLEIQPLFEGSAALAASDLPALADLLREHCAAEADFVLRGGSLMDRVRLALLRAPNLCLSPSELAAQTGDRLSHIQHKLRQAAGSWIEWA